MSSEEVVRIFEKIVDFTKLSQIDANILKDIYYVLHIYYVVVGLKKFSLWNFKINDSPKYRLTGPSAWGTGL